MLVSSSVQSRARKVWVSLDERAFGVGEHTLIRFIGHPAVRSIRAYFPSTLNAKNWWLPLPSTPDLE